MTIYFPEPIPPARVRELLAMSWADCRKDGRKPHPAWALYRGSAMLTWSVSRTGANRLRSKFWDGDELTLRRATLEDVA